MSLATSGSAESPDGQRNGRLEIVNENGDLSDGVLLDVNTIVATDWGHLIGKFDTVPGKFAS